MKFVISVVIAVVLIITSVEVSFSQDGSSLMKSYLAGLEAGAAGEFANAEAAFSEALSIAPGFLPAERWLKALKGVKSGRVERAALIYTLKGEGFRKNGDTAAAKEEYERAVKLDPEFIEAHMGMGQVFYSEGLFAEALRSFERAVALEPGYAAAYVARGSMLVSLGEEKKALDDFEEALKINPDNASAFIALGSLHMEADRTEDALKNFNSAVEFSPRAPSAYSLRGYLYMVKLRDRERGCADWKRACELGECDNLRSAIMAGLCS